MLLTVPRKMKLEDWSSDLAMWKSLVNFIRTNFWSEGDDKILIAVTQLICNSHHSSESFHHLLSDTKDCILDILFNCHKSLQFPGKNIYQWQLMPFFKTITSMPLFFYFYLFAINTHQLWKFTGTHECVSSFFFCLFQEGFNSSFYFGCINFQRRFCHFLRKKIIFYAMS